MDSAITRAEVIPYALPFKDLYVTSRGELKQREMVLLRVHSEAAVGLGEAVPMTLRNDHSLAGVADELRDWGEAPEQPRDQLSEPARWNECGPSEATSRGCWKPRPGQGNSPRRTHRCGEPELI